MHARALPGAALAALARAGYARADDSFPDGRRHALVALTAADGAPLIAKLYPDGNGRAGYDHMVALWGSPFGARRTPAGLPRPVAYVEQAGALVMERVEGSPMAHRGAISEPSLTAAIELLVDLHGSGAPALDHRTPEAIIRSMRRKAGVVRDAAPGLFERFVGVIDALDAARPGTVELRPGHGDFYQRNLLVSADRMVLIDWDSFGHADPARDLANFGAWSWATDLVAGQPPEWSVLRRATARYEHVSPGAVDDIRMRFYAGAGLMRIARVLARRPHCVAHVPRILDEADGLLRRRTGRLGLWEQLLLE